MQDKTKKAVNSDFSKRVGCGDVDDQNVVFFGWRYAKNFH
jgi:hypothetical protein